MKRVGLGLSGGIAVVCATLTVGLPSLVFPFGRDQGNYAYAAWTWLDGAALYRDVFVFKPPATVFVHALAIGLFGPTMSAIRLLDLGWTAAIALTVASVARGLGLDRTVAAAAGAIYALVYYQQTYWTTAQTDGWMNLPMLLALSITLAGRGDTRTSWPRAAAAGAPPAGEPVARTLLPGILVGTAMVFKYTAAVVLLPIVIELLAQHRAERGRSPSALVLRLASLCFGVAAPLLLTGGWLAATGAWPAFVDCQVSLVSTYVSATRHFGLLDGSKKVASQLWTNSGLEVGGRSAMLGLGWMLVRSTWGPIGRSEARLRLLLVGGLFLAGTLSCVSQGKLFMYHYLPILPGLAIAGSIGIVETGRLFIRRLPQPLRPGAWLLVALALVASTRIPERYRTASKLVPTGLEHHWRTSPAYRTVDFSLSDNLKLVDELLRITTADDRVFLWGFEPLVNFVAQRKTVSRFLYNYPFAVAWGNESYEKELLDALAATPPAVFVVSSHDATPGVTGNKADSAKLFVKFSKLRAFVRENYEDPTEVRRFKVYRRKSADPTRTADPAAP